MKKALITGMTGMVGSHLADFLLANTDWDIYGMQRWRSAFENIAHLSERINSGDRVFVRYGDLNDQTSLITVLEEVSPDYIFHLAAQSYPQTSFTAPIDTLNTEHPWDCAAAGKRPDAEAGAGHPCLRVQRSVRACAC